MSNALNRACNVLTAALVALAAALPARAGDIIPVFRLSGPLPEAPPPMDVGFMLGGGAAPVSMFDLLKRLNEARKDETVRAVVFELDEAALGMAQVQELRSQFEKLKAADKDVWVFAETLGPSQYCLAAAASKLVMMPRGVLALMGLYGEGIYLKNLLDNLRIQAHIIHCGDYKSAGEPLYRTGPSKEAQEQDERLFDGLYDLLCESIAESRKLGVDEVRKLFDRAILSPEDALQAKLVDELMYKEEFLRVLTRKYGSDTKLVRKYGKKKGPDVDLSNPFAFFNFFTEMIEGGTQKDKPAIGVVYIDSVITQGRSEQSPFGGGNSGSTTIRRAIEKAAEDESIKAIVLRVDSPGGSAVASEIICEAVNRYKRSKPLVVSMGNVAASGGYYVSCNADTIFAQPGTLTGSIGVVGGKLVTKGFWEWIGVTGHEYKRGRHADVLNSNRPFDSEEEKLIRRFMTRVYDEFKDRVTKGRGKKLKTDDIESIAGGRVYTGKHAYEIGLVDKLGGLADAVAFAADEADVSRYEIRVVPEPQNFIDMILKELLGKEEDDELNAATPAVPVGPDALASVLPALRTLDPGKAAAVQRLLALVNLLAGERVLAVEANIPLLR